MRPAVFADLDFTTALERATGERKLLLVDATAEWCGPCHMMDRTTWVDPAVVAWLGDHAFAIQVDVDAQKDVARELNIQAMPTIIAFVEGKEFDRVVGAKKPKELLAWLDAVTRGETSLVVSKRLVQREPADMSARLALARQLTQTGRYDEAIVEHVWLWEHMLEHQPSMYGVRLSFFAADLGTLVHAHAPARTAIAELRDRAAPPASGPIDEETFHDWNCLNGVLGEQSHTLAWYDALPATTRPRLGPLLEKCIVPLLIAADRWADAGALYDDPLATIDRAAQLLAHALEDLPAAAAERMRDYFRKNAANLVRALHAAGRVPEIDAVASRAREIDPSDEMQQALAAARAASGPEA
jgi:thiol-disulfide isomerase/thioredoxin